MALHNKKDFAAKTGHTTKTLAVQKSRGKVVYEENGLIDDCNPTNRSFLLTYSHKAEAKIIPVASDDQIPREETYRTPVYNNDSEDTDGIPQLNVSDRRYKHWLATKTERAAELDRLKIEKLKGEVIPSELIPPVILQHNQCFITSFKNVMDEILTDYAKIKSFSVEEIAMMRGKILESINNGAKTATSMSLKAVSIIVKDYSVRRGVGEK